MPSKRSRQHARRRVARRVVEAFTAPGPQTVLEWAEKALDESLKDMYKRRSYKRLTPAGLTPEDF
jgi:hypothetical protein